MGTVALHIGKGVVGVSLTEGAVENLDFGNGGHNLLVGAVVEVAGHILGGTVGKFHVHSDALGVSTGEELRLDAGDEQEHRYGQQSHKARYDYQPALYGPMNNMSVTS